MNFIYFLRFFNFFKEKHDKEKIEKMTHDSIENNIFNIKKKSYSVGIFISIILGSFIIFLILTSFSYITQKEIDSNYINLISLLVYTYLIAKSFFSTRAYNQ